MCFLNNNLYRADGFIPSLHIKTLSQNVVKILPKTMQLLMANPGFYLLFNLLSYTIPGTTCYKQSLYLLGLCGRYVDLVVFFLSGNKLQIKRTIVKFKFSFIFCFSKLSEDSSLVHFRFPFL